MPSRLAAIAARPRQTLASLALVLAAVGVAAGSGADFSSRIASAQSTFTAGTLSIGGGGTAILSATGLRPGDARSGIADIENSGSVSGDFSLHAATPAGSGALAARLTLVVRDCGTFAAGAAPDCTADDPSVYDGTLAGLTRVPLGHWAAGERHRFAFATGFPLGTPETDDPLQGTSSSRVFEWEAVS